MTDAPEQVLNGIGVGSGAVVGPIRHFAAAVVLPADEPAPTTPEEKQQASAAVTEALGAVATELREAAEKHRGETLGEVLTAASEMANDPALLEESINLIDEGVAPAHAVTQVAATFAEMFTAAGGYLAERVTDLNSVRDRVVARLTGQGDPGAGALDVASVICAIDLSPADTATLDMTKVLGIVTAEGGPTAHTAIIARQLGLPCIVRCTGILAVPEGTVVAVDSASGKVIVDPDPELAAGYAARAEAIAKLAEDTEPGGTSDGHHVQLLANIGTVEDAEAAAKQAVEGVGLFRTEVVFLDAKTEPSVEEQVDIYTRVLKAFAGRKVVVRTLDAGADKPLAFANMTHEENPALGVRGFRLIRTLSDVVTNQLKALGEAAAAVPETDTWVMAPMIATTQEGADFRDLAAAAGIKKIGVMVEVPSVALRAHQVLAQVDFASIGTNDLAQYAMAGDRLDGQLSDLVNPWQPAVLTLIELTAKAGAKLGRPVGVCGEAAADPLLALVLTGLGVTSLSMSTTALAEVRFALRHTSLATCQAMATAAVEAVSPQEAREAVIGLLEDEVRHVLLGMF